MNDVWAFVSDRLFDDRAFRILTIVDCHTREARARVDELPRVSGRRRPGSDHPDPRLTRSIRVDNEPEFAGRMFDQWAVLNKIELDFSRPGKPSDNAYIEAFNGRLRQECLNASWFLWMADTRQRIEALRTDYNEQRPHSALGNFAPNAFAASLKPARRIA